MKTSIIRKPHAGYVSRNMFPSRHSKGGIYLHMSNGEQIQAPKLWRFAADGTLKSLTLPYSPEYGVCKATHIANGKIYGTITRGGKSDAGIIYSVPIPPSQH